AMMIANDPAVATAIRATAFTPMPLTGRSVLRVLTEAQGDKPRPAAWRRRELNRLAPTGTETVFAISRTRPQRRPSAGFGPLSARGRRGILTTRAKVPNQAWSCRLR